MDKSIQRFLDAQNRLVIQMSDLSLESLASMALSGSIDLSPKYQRRERWSAQKQSALIESFLLNIPVPPIYLSEDEYGEYSVIDGKQRITAIRNFMKTDMKLEKLEKFVEVEGLTFLELPEQLRNALSIRPFLRVVTLLKQSDPQLKYEVFTRLNTGGEKLLAQEIRNVAFRGKYNDMLYKLSDNQFLRKQLNIKNNKAKSYQQMIDVEYVLRFFTIREHYADFPGSMKVAMNNHMELHADDNAIQISKSVLMFAKAIEIAEKIWGNDAFRRPDEGSSRKMIQGVYDVQTVPFSLLSTVQQNKISSNINLIKQEFKKLYLNDAKFRESITQFTSNSESVEYRISKMKKKLVEILK